MVGAEFFFIWRFHWIEGNIGCQILGGGGGGGGGGCSPPAPLAPTPLYLNLL